MTEEKYHSGFISIIGRPNVGKSTLLNAILGQKIAITSNKPQTTRNRILGIHTENRTQMLFIDTPGIHRAKGLLNEFMVNEALASCADVDLILFLVEAGDRIGGGDDYILELIKKSGIPCILVINKIDMIEKGELMPQMAGYAGKHAFDAIIPVSAMKKDGVKELLAEVARRMPEGPVYYPEDMVTDLPEKFIVAEMVREQVFRKTSQEIPYGVAVTIDRFVESDGISPVEIAATVHVVRDGHKKIIVGRQGQMIKEIGISARREVQRLLGTRVHLELFVRVQKNWTDSRRLLSEMGYE